MSETPPVIPDSAKQRQGRLVMLAIVAIFVLPFLVLPLFMSPEKMHKTNKGILLDPPVSFSALQASDENHQALPVLPLKKWFVLYVLPAACEGACVDARDHALFTLKNIQQVLGHDGDRVQPLVVLTAEPAPEQSAQLQQITDVTSVRAEANVVDQAFASVLQGKASEAGNLYLMSPDGYVFIYYGAEADRTASLRRADDMKSDLKKSLQGSRI